MPSGLEEQGGSYWDRESQLSSEGGPPGAVAFADLAGKESGNKRQPASSSFSSPCSAPCWLRPTRSQRPGEPEEAVDTGGREGQLAWCGPDGRTEGGGGLGGKQRMSSSGRGGGHDCSHRCYCVTHLPETPRPDTRAIRLTVSGSGAQEGLSLQGRPGWRLLTVTDRRPLELDW